MWLWLVLLGLLQLGEVLLLGGVVSTPSPVVGGPDGVVAAPVALAEDPGQHVHLVVQLRGELGADEVGDAGPLAAGDEAGVLVVAAVLGSQGGAVEGEHGAQAEARRRLVDVQALLGATGVPPSEALALPLIPQVDGTVDGLQWVGAGAAGQICQHLAHVLGEEVALAVQPLLTAVHLWGKGTERVRAHTAHTLHPALPSCHLPEASPAPPAEPATAGQEQPGCWDGLEPSSNPEAVTEGKGFALGQSCLSQGVCLGHPSLQGLGWQHPTMGEGMWQAGLSHPTVKQDCVVPGLWEETGFPA